METRHMRVTRHLSVCRIDRTLPHPLLSLLHRLEYLASSSESELIHGLLPQPVCNLFTLRCVQYWGIPAQVGVTLAKCEPRGDTPRTGHQRTHSRFDLTVIDKAPMGLLALH